MNTYNPIQKLVKDLLNTRLTQAKLAEMVGCSQSLITAFLNGHRGKRPSMDIGIRITNLHKKLCKQTTTDQDDI